MPRCLLCGHEWSAGSTPAAPRLPPVEEEARRDLSRGKAWLWFFAVVGGLGVLGVLLAQGIPVRVRLFAVAMVTIPIFVGCLFAWRGRGVSLDNTGGVAVSVLAGVGMGILVGFALLIGLALIILVICASAVGF